MEQLTVNNYVELVEDRLNNEGFEFIDGAYQGYYFFSSVAKKFSWSGKVGNFAETYFCFTELLLPTPDNLVDYAAECLKFAGKIRRAPAVFSWLIWLECIPVAIVNGIDSRALDFIRREEPAMHWGAFTLPVIYDLVTNRVSFFEGTPLGKTHFNRWRKEINRLLAP